MFNFLELQEKNIHMRHAKIRIPTYHDQFLHFSGCTFCGKQFRQLSTLSNHVKIHTGEFMKVQTKFNCEYNVYDYVQSR